MKIAIVDSTIVCTRESRDPYLSRAGYAAGWAPEHRLLYWVKKALAAQGVTLVKTTVGRDYEKGLMHHLMDDKLPYLRPTPRQLGKGGPWDVLIIDLNYQVNNTVKDWAAGKVVLNIVCNPGAEPPVLEG